MKKLIFTIAITAFTLSFAQETPKKSCCTDKAKKECSTKDKKECSDKDKKACTDKDKKACTTKDKKSCCRQEKSSLKIKNTENRCFFMHFCVCIL
jgi:hypothetical protein